MAETKPARSKDKIMLTFISCDSSKVVLIFLNHFSIDNLKNWVQLSASHCYKNATYSNVLEMYGLENVYVYILASVFLSSSET